MQSKFLAAVATSVVAFGMAITAVEAAPGIGLAAAGKSGAAPIESITYGWHRGCSHVWGHCHWRYRYCHWGRCQWGQRRWGGHPSWSYPWHWGQDHRGYHGWAWASPSRP